MMGKRVIRLGDRTTHGGTVVSGAGNFKMFGKAVARLGDKVTCPIRGHGSCTIVEGDPLWSIDGKAVALEGHKISCGASLISSLPQVTRSYEGMGAGAAAAVAEGAVAVPAHTAARANQAREERHALCFRALITGTTDADGYTDPIQADAAGRNRSPCGVSGAGTGPHWRNWRDPAKNQGRPRQRK